jgi:hypothetical protein
VWKKAKKLHKRNPKNQEAIFLSFRRVSSFGTELFFISHIFLVKPKKKSRKKTVGIDQSFVNLTQQTKTRQQEERHQVQ